MNRDKALMLIAYTEKNNKPYMLYQNIKSHPYLKQLCTLLDNLNKTNYGGPNNLQLAIDEFRYNRFIRAVRWHKLTLLEIKAIKEGGKNEHS